MKRLISVLVAVFFMTGMVVAQSNNSDVDQTGNDHTANVDQNGEANQSDIIQDQGHNYHLMEKGSSADVDQDGKDNSSSLNQGGGWWNAAVITQDGIGNSSAINQQNDINEAIVNQVGENNILRGKSEGSAATQKTGGPYGEDNYFDVEQIGNNNVVGMEQVHGAEALVQQEGDDNYSEVYQTSSPNGIDNEANVDINGDDNTTSIKQDGNGNSATMNVGHILYQDENFSNVISTMQEGTGNDAVFNLQKGNSNEVAIDQMGTNNFTQLNIKYGSNNEATYDIDGESNRSRVYIRKYSNFNELDLTQDGYKNYASGAVKGSENTIDVMQKGENNRVGTSWHTNDGFNIHGSNNTITIDQMSDGNMSKNSVSGNGNTINVIQQ